MMVHVAIGLDLNVSDGVLFQVDKHESARAVKKAELIDNLKRLYPGVVSTLQQHLLTSSLISSVLLNCSLCSDLPESVSDQPGLTVMNH